MTQSQKIRVAKANYPIYLRSDKHDLLDAYKTPSAAKCRAGAHCKELCESLGGWGLKVIHFNTFTFTAGFEFCDGLGVVHFMYISPSYEQEVEACGIA